jgi:hypothetical protein
MRGVKTVVLVGLFQLVSVSPALAGPVSVLIVSEPAGGSLLAPDDQTVTGALPLTRTYTTPDPWRACVTFQGFTVRWPNGAKVNVGRIELCPEDGQEQVVRVSLPGMPETPLTAPAASGQDVLCREGALVYKPANGRCPNGTMPSPAPAGTPTQPAGLQRTPPRVTTPQARRGATTLPVIVLDRRFSETSYAFIVPGIVSTYRASNANCFANTTGSVFASTLGNTVSGTVNSSTAANCYGSGTSTSLITPAQSVQYSVRGATFSLQLPDRRVAVVNCDSKFNWTEFSGGPRRSCRIPTIDRFDVEFNGDKAKLVWRVGINGEKKVSETYDLIQILDPPQP